MTLVAALTLASLFDPRQEIASLTPEAKACAAFYVVSWTGPEPIARYTYADLTRVLKPGPLTPFTRAVIALRDGRLDEAVSIALAAPQLTPNASAAALLPRACR